MVRTIVYLLLLVCANARTRSGMPCVCRVGVPSGLLPSIRALGTRKACRYGFTQATFCFPRNRLVCSNAAGWKRVTGLDGNLFWYYTPSASFFTTILVWVMVNH